MATTTIHSITATVSNCLSYCSNDKVEKALKDDIADVIDYARNDKTGDFIFKTITSTLNCKNCGDDTITDFKERIQQFANIDSKRRNKNLNNKPAIAFHLIQSFDGIIPPALAHRIGIETAEELFRDKYKVQISTHTNTENTHNHFVFTAWDKNGKKWHDCNETKRLIRKVSDRICREYGLEILENTKDFKVVTWKDKDGKTHIYEPTKRKSELIKKRENDEISNDDISSYRNSDSYQEYMTTKQSRRDIVKHDIETMLPYATSYEHLLNLMREHLGYEIKDKKKNGDWLAHTAFKSPTSDSFLRDYKLDEERMFTREFLSDFIEKQSRENTPEYTVNTNNRNHKIEEINTSYGELKEEDILIMDSYTYSDIDVSRLSEDKRAYRDSESGEREYAPRGEVEKPIVRSVKNHDKELRETLYSGGFNSTVIDDIIKREQQQVKIKKYHLKAQHEAMVQKAIQDIQDKLFALRFLEKDSVQSYSKMNSLFKGYWEKYNQVFESINVAEKKLLSRERVLKFPTDLQATLDRIEKGKDDSDYMNNEYSLDVNRAEKLRELIEKYYPKTEKELSDMKESVVGYRTRINELNDTLVKYKDKLTECEKCVSILRDIDSVNAQQYESLWAEFDKIDSAGKETEKDNKKEQNNNKRGYVR